MDILFQDKYLIIINKIQNLMIEPDNYGHPNLQDQVSDYLKKPGIKKEIFLQPVHRLDRPVSGIILFALKPSSLKNMNEQFAGRTVEKNYLAITENKPKKISGALHHFLFKDAANKKAIIYDKEKPGSQAVELDYEIIGSKSRLFLWKIKLHTGKFHQIRAQLAHTGCPIVGDQKYGSAYSYKPDAIALHAHQLSFFHPQTNERMVIEAPPPNDRVWNLFS